MKIDQPIKRFRRQSLILPFLIIAGTVAIVYALMATRPRLDAVEKPERIWPVNVVEARYQTVQPQLHLFGEVVAGRRSELRPRVSGLIVKVGPNFRDGGIVRKGDLLVEVDPFEYETTLAERRSVLKEAKVRFEMLRRDHERAKELFEEKNVSEQFLDNTELELLQQEAIVEQREISIAQAERDLADTKLLAPYDGVVNNVSANLGNQVSGFGSDKVADLVDTGRLEVRFSLSNAQYGRLLESGESLIDRPVDIIWEVGDKTLNYHARIERVGAEIASTTGGVDVYAAIDSEARQTSLRPGAFVGAQLADKPYEDVLVAPDSALYGEDIVYLAREERLVERRIDIRGYDGNSLLFRSSDEPFIKNGDLIVTTQLREGGSGAKVEVR